MERVVAGGIRYELVDEDGEQIGELTSEETAFAPGDMVPCSGHTYEVVRADGDALHVRRVI